MMTPLHRLSALQLVLAVTRGEITCAQIAESCIDRVNQREAVLQAWAHFDPAAILAQARKLDAATVRGPLHGVPVGVKDIIETHDMPTQMGSPIYRGHQPAADASCVAMLRAAGALIVGKTATCEFAGPSPALSTNPHDVTRTPGGSSSGSAAAVADFMVPLALGTQTGGSVQRPSSYCGIVGYKPTFGLINTAGVKPAAQSLDTVGLMASSVAEIELAARVLTNAAQTMWLPTGTLIRVGLCRTHHWDTAQDCTRDALLDSSQRLRADGHRVQDAELPASFGELSGIREIVNDYERARAMAYEWQNHSELISDALAGSIRRGLAIPADVYCRALQRLESFRLSIAPLFERFDVLITPTVTGEASVGLSYTGDHKLQSIWTQLRTPTLNLPTHVGPNGMPVGIQVVGKPYGDRELLAHAQLIFELLGAWRGAPAKDLP